MCCSEAGLGFRLPTESLGEFSDFGVLLFHRRQHVRRAGYDGDHLLGEDVEWVAREARGLDVGLVHGAGHGGAGYEVGAVFGEDDAFADGADGVAGAADALHAAGDGGWRLDLDDEVDGAHVDAEFEGGGGAQAFELAGFELLLDDAALRRC